MSKKAFNERWKTSPFKGKMETGAAGGTQYRFMKEGKRIKWYMCTTAAAAAAAAVWNHILASKVPKSKFTQGTIIIRTKKYGFQKPARKKRQWLAFKSVTARRGTVIPDEQLHTVPLHVKKLIQPKLNRRRIEPRAPRTPSPGTSGIRTRSQTASAAAAAAYELKHDPRTGGYDWYLNGQRVAHLRVEIQEQTRMPLLIPTKKKE